MKTAISNLVLILILSTTSSVLAANNTPNYWKCSNKVFGSWSLFGVYTEACDVDPFGDRSELKRTYSPLVITNKPSTSQVSSYMTEMYAVVRDISAYYIKKRKPSVSAAEVKAFQEAIFALSHQESFWSHYRDTSTSNLKMIRGDSGHGHGLMQVDDRHHYVGIKDSGVGANLGVHFAYALDIYFEAWEKAPSKSCVGSATNYVARTRAAYSAYNGGMGSICRFTNPKHTWARNDVGFYDKFKQKQWLQKVSNTGKKAAVNITCLSEGREDCPTEPPPTPNPPPPPPGPKEFATNLFYKNSNGLVCAYTPDKLLCLSDYRDAACLNAVLGRNIQNTEDFTSGYRTVPIEVLDRNIICPASVTGLGKIGTYVRLKKTINMRSTAAGALVKTASANIVAQILDFEVKNDGVQSRYYKIESGGKKGFIFAGSKTTFAEWTVAAHAPVTTKLVADVNDQISVVNRAGINQRKSIGGSVLQTIPAGTILTVKKVIIQSSNNDLYYMVDYKNKSGYIYGGQGFPKNTYANWNKVLSTARTQSAALAQVSGDVYYKNLQNCDAQGCTESDNFVPGPKMETDAENKELEVLEVTNNGWSLVKQTTTGAIGWIRSSDIEMK